MVKRKRIDILTNCQLSNCQMCGKLIQVLSQEGLRLCALCWSRMPPLDLEPDWQEKMIEEFKCNMEMLGLERFFD